MKQYTKPEVSVISFEMTEAITFGSVNEDDVVVGGGYSENIEWWE